MHFQQKAFAPHLQHKQDITTYKIQRVKEVSQEVANIPLLGIVKSKEHQLMQISGIYQGGKRPLFVARVIDSFFPDDLRTAKNTDKFSRTETFYHSASVAMAWAVRK